MARPDTTRLLIGTQHPDFGGGVLTMLHAFTRWARQQRDVAPAVAYSPLSPRDLVNAGPAALLGRRPSRREESWNGLPAHCVGRRFARVEAWHCRGNQAQWRAVLDGYDAHQIVCGYALTAMPQALSGKPFVVWVATSMDGDKQARLTGGRWLHRLAHTLQIRELRRQERFVLERAAWVMALSPHTQTELLERGARSERMSVVRCPIDTSVFFPADQLPAQPTIIWSGRHNDPRKRTGLLLRAFARALPAAPTARLLLIGEGGGEIARQVAELHVAHAVELLGPQPLARMPDFLRRGSVFAIPSEQEGLCIAGLEAMACGLPVVSTRCGGPQAFVVPGKTGILIDIDDEDALTEALRLLLTDEARRRELSAGARRLIEEEFGPDEFARQVRQIYATVWPDRFTATAEYERVRTAQQP